MSLLGGSASYPYWTGAVQPIGKLGKVPDLRTWGTRRRRGNDARSPRFFIIARPAPLSSLFRAAVPQYVGFGGAGPGLTLGCRRAYPNRTGAKRGPLTTVRFSPPRLIHPTPRFCTSRTAGSGENVPCGRCALRPRWPTVSSFMTQAQPEKRPAQEQGENPSGYESFKPSPLPDERLAEIRARSTERFDAYDSDTRWLLRYVDMLRKDNEQLRTRRTSFEHKMFTVVTVLVGLAVIGVIAYDIYLQPSYEILRAGAAWSYDYTEHLPRLSER